MITIRNSDHVRTRRHLKSFRLCPTSTGRSMWRTEVARIHQQEVALINRELRRRWLAETWSSRLQGGRRLQESC